MSSFDAYFAVGALVTHRLFHYRGVVFDVDPQFAGTEAWYEEMARSRPPKDRPWYYVLVHGASHTTYVAERNLTADHSGRPIDHPAVGGLFTELRDGGYVSAKQSN